jgi:hypothetical protein
MPIACIYHKELPMRVVSFEERERLVATGEWYRHPSCKPEITKEEPNHEKPIRRKPKQRSVDSK